MGYPLIHVFLLLEPPAQVQPHKLMAHKLLQLFLQLTHLHLRTLMVLLQLQLQTLQVKQTYLLAHLAG